MFIPPEAELKEFELKFKLKPRILLVPLKFVFKTRLKFIKFGHRLKKYRVGKNIV